MNILETIDQDLIKAQKEKNEIVILVLRMLKSNIKNKEIEKREELKNEDILDIISKEVKKRKESAQAYKEGGREELAEKELEEYNILSNYLPEQLSEDDIRKIIREAIEKTGASIVSDMGKVMGEIMPQVKGKADGSLVSKIVKEELNK